MLPVELFEILDEGLSGAFLVLGVRCIHDAHRGNKEDSGAQSQMLQAMPCRAGFVRNHVACHLCFGGASHAYLFKSQHRNAALHIGQWQVQNVTRGLISASRPVTFYKRALTLFGSGGLGRSVFAGVCLRKTLDAITQLGNEIDLVVQRGKALRIADHGLRQFIDL